MKKNSSFKINLSINDFIEYFFGTVSFARTIHDKSVIEHLPLLEGNIVEIGASNHDYSKYTKYQYIKTNMSKINSEILIMDARKMNFEDNSIDNFVCFSVLEHIYEYNKVISEVYRCLKPNGKFILITPWIFPFHGAPDDYFRYSKSTLQEILSRFQECEIKSVGSYYINMAFLLQKPEWNTGKKVLKSGIGSILRKTLGLIFLLIAKITKNLDDDYVMLYTSIAKK